MSSHAGSQEGVCESFLLIFYGPMAILSSTFAAFTQLKTLLEILLGLLESQTSSHSIQKSNAEPN